MRTGLFISLLLLLFPTAVHAVENPQVSPNNKFGIHIVDENDLDKARELVNSSGGDWGYIVVVIQESERSHERWQEVFDKMRESHLIPIVRIATKPSPEGWAKPIKDETDGWIDFLSSLNWVVKNRYVIIGNEPNQAHEWGGEVNPEEYADYLAKFSQKLKEANADFFVLQGGFDASATNGKLTMEEGKFIGEMLKASPNVFDNIDGLASHSYPNPKLSASNQSGKGTLRTFSWELDYLKSLGVTKDFPVFITETGWKHDGGGNFKKVQIDYSYAFSKIWNDERVVAVVPFLLSYKDKPFLNFSWLDPTGKPYDFYYQVANIPKIKGEPEQITSGGILGNLYFPVVQANHGIYGLALIENTGQTIWRGGEYTLSNTELLTKIDIYPFQTKILFYRINSPDKSELFTPELSLSRNGITFGNPTKMYIRVVKFLPIFQVLPKFW